MKFEKLLISKQLQEKKKVEQDYADQLKSLDAEIEHWRYKRQAKENEDQNQQYHNNKMYGGNSKGSGSHMYNNNNNANHQGRGWNNNYQ